MVQNVVYKVYYNHSCHVQFYVISVRLSPIPAIACALHNLQKRLSGDLKIVASGRICA